MLGRIDTSFIGPAILSPMPTILEGEAFKVMLRALTADLALTTPNSARYRIDDLIQSNAVLDWTPLTPSTVMSILVTSAQNVLRNGLWRERRQLVVEASDTDGPLRRVVDYDIQAILGLD